MKKSIFAVALMIGAASFSFAGTPKTNDAKVASEAPAESKAKETFTYYVTGQTVDQTQYTLSSSPAPGCGSGSLPCQIESTEQLSSPINKADVDDNDNVEIITHRASL